MGVREWSGQAWRWLLPSALEGTEYTLAEVRRLHITRLLPGLFIASFAFSRLFDRAARLGQPWDALTTYGAAACILGICCWLCHRRQALWAAWLFVWAVASYAWLVALQISLPPRYSPAEAVMLFLLASCIAGVLVSARASLIVIGALVVALWAGLTVGLGDPWRALQHGLIVHEIAIAGAIFLWVGVGKFHESLYKAHQTETLAYMNERLEASMAAQEHSARQIDVMRAVAHACASVAEEVAVAEAALREMVHGLDGDAGIIVMRDEAQPDFARLVAVHAPDPHFADLAAEVRTQLATLNIAPDAPLNLLRVIATGVAQFEIPLAGTPFSMHDGHLSPLVCLPLSFRGRVLGALALGWTAERSHTISASERELLVSLVDEVATSLHRAQLYEEARRLALYDPLTGLYNHRAMQQIAARELAHARASDQPISVIMLDIDHFRRFNETYGHDVGDQALRAVARSLHAAVRASDHAARYGGEEFAIIMPHTTNDEAALVAARIGRAIREDGFCLDVRTQAQVRLTASLGYATFPAHASAMVSLFKAADLALYAAKRGGRDMAVGYSSALLHHQAHSQVGLAQLDAADISLPTGADLDAVQALITAIDLRDGYTAAHSDGVARWSVAIGAQLGLPAEHIEALRLGGLIHDVGKIGVPDHVLRKPGKLDPDEWEVMQRHTVMGDTILRSVEQLHHLLPLVRWHHERLDGSGYPDGLHGDQIPPLVRILSVADVFDAFTAERPYHPARTAAEGAQLVRDSAAQGQLDPTVVAAFLTVLRAEVALSDADVSESLPRAA